MSDIVVGLLALVIGAAFCFGGYLAMRVIIPLWGALTGFLLGAGLVDAWTDSGFLATVPGWIFGVVLAIIFGLLAYSFYEIAVIIAMSAIGFAVGTGVMTALEVNWSWAVILVGVAVGVLLAMIAIVGDLPMVILTVLTAIAGATAVVAGLMLIFDVVGLGEFDSIATTRGLDDDWWWYAIFVVFVIGGILVQMRSTVDMRGTLRDSWEASGGRRLRT